jgi:para-nitrobenzyl esterase
VTVFGQSAGGEQVLALLVSPPAAGLFHRAISMSAPAGLPLPDVSAAAARRAAFLKRLGCEDSATQLSLLRHATAQSLINAAQISWDIIATGGIQFAPTVGGGVLPGQWLDLYRQGKFHHVPVMIGHTKQEGRLLTAIHENNLGRGLTRADVTERLAASGMFPEPLIKAIAREYGLDSTPDIGSTIADILVDSTWVTGLEKCRAALARETTVYSYQTFDPDAPESHVHARFSKIGAGHDSDLPELWQWDDFLGEPPTLTAEQQRYAVQLGRYFGQFAATGDPNGADLPTWRTTNQGYIQYLETDHTGGTRSITNAEYQEDHKYRFWSPLIHPEPRAGRPGQGSDA